MTSIIVFYRCKQFLKLIDVFKGLFIPCLLFRIGFVSNIKKSNSNQIKSSRVQQKYNPNQIRKLNQSSQIQAVFSFGSQSWGVPPPPGQLGGAVQIYFVFNT